MDADQKQISAWLRGYETQPITYEAYMREAVRFHFWCRQVKGIKFRQVDETDIRDYVKFLAAPPAQYVSRRKLPLDHPDWKPFAKGSLSEDSIKLALSVVSRLFGRLSDLGYRRGNPVNLVLQPFRKGRQSPPTYKRIQPVQWKALQAYLASQAPIDAAAYRLLARNKWMLALLYHGQLSAVELAQPANLMRNFHYRSDKSGLMLSVLNRQGHPRTIPVSPELEAALAEFRRAMDKHKLPLAEDFAPLVASERQDERPMTRQGIYAAVRSVLLAAADYLKTHSRRGSRRFREADALAGMSPTWFSKRQGTDSET